LGSVEGVIDVSIIIPVCFQNPLKKFAVEFIKKVLLLEKRVIIPVTAIIGAYHIATRYIGVPRADARKILVELLQTRSPAFYPHINIDTAVESLDIASIYNIESWDSYLIALARGLGTKTIYTLDRELEKIPEINIEIPFPQSAVKEYHEYLKTLIAKHLKKT